MFNFSSKLAAAAAAFCLSGCYVVPMNPDGTPAYVIPGAPAPGTLHARLYPANDVATQTGVLTGTITQVMSGKGRLQLDYRGELLSGEATRVSGDDRRGLANAYGQRGTFMSCEYQMHTPQQGAGTCTVSNGAKYQVHVGG
jgi:hypothetical protein